MALRSVDGSAIESPEGFPLVAILAGAGGTDIGGFFKNVLGLETWALIFAVEKGAQRTHGCGSSGRTGASLPRNAFASQRFFSCPLLATFSKSHQATDLIICGTPQASLRIKKPSQRLSRFFK